MRRHTLIGERILGAAPALRPVAELVALEPRALATAAATPTASRARRSRSARGSSRVCDAYDAMTTDRPYQRRARPREALAELRRCAGTQFDPGVVEAFCRVSARETADAAE